MNQAAALLAAVIVALAATAGDRYELPRSALSLAVCYAADGCMVESVRYELAGPCQGKGAPDDEHFKVWGSRVAGHASISCRSRIDRNPSSRFDMVFGDEIAIVGTEMAEGSGVRLFGVSAYGREIPLAAAQGMADYIRERRGDTPHDLEEIEDNDRVESLNRWLVTPRNVCYHEKYWAYGRPSNGPPTLDDWARMDWIMVDHGVDGDLHAAYPGGDALDGQLDYCLNR